jgi:NodT family efflux transporter outer membrane factor (OMF) lipoprotein
MKNLSRIATCLFLSGACLALTACAVGPDYKRPSMAMPAHYKQLDGWKQATPQDDRIKGTWWDGYADPELSALLAQVRISNQNVAEYLAAYEKAQALVSAANANFFPTVTATVSNSRSGGNSATSTSTSNSAKLGASWEPDIWGKLRRTAEEDTASAQASAAQLASATLSAQSSLAQDYFQLRVMDEEIRLYQQTVDAYTRYLQIVQKQYELGSASRGTLATAQTQLESARASALDVTWQRAQLEHAIAVLIGKPPAEFSIAAKPLAYTLPNIPVGLPSTLLERRPDVAYAERNMAAANAAIGVAKAAYFPDLTLSGSGGYSSSAWRNLVSLPNSAWSLGASLSGTVLDFGATSASVRQAEAGYNGQVATYRQTVLTALQEVEDYLVELHTLGEEVTVQQRAADAARVSERQYRNQYQEGMVSYLDVATAQATSLSQQQSLLSLVSDQLVSSVKLIAALGGGWDAKALGTE